MISPVFVKVLCAPIFAGSAVASEKTCLPMQNRRNKRYGDAVERFLRVAQFFAHQFQRRVGRSKLLLRGRDGQRSVTDRLLAACRTWGVESENWPQRGQFLPHSPPHSPAMGQEGGEKWTAAADLQPTLPKPDRLPEPAPSRPARCSSSARNRSTPAPVLAKSAISSSRRAGATSIASILLNTRISATPARMVSATARSLAVSQCATTMCSTSSARPISRRVRPTPRYGPNPATIGSAPATRPASRTLRADVPCRPKQRPAPLWTGP